VWCGGVWCGVVLCGAVWCGGVAFVARDSAGIPDPEATEVWQYINIQFIAMAINI